MSTLIFSLIPAPVRETETFDDWQEMRAKINKPVRLIKIDLSA
jgi:hypothetical protein